jgi:hypothetical protein
MFLHNTSSIGVQVLRECECRLHNVMQALGLPQIAAFAKENPYLFASVDLIPELWVRQRPMESRSRAASPRSPRSPLNTSPDIDSTSHSPQMLDTKRAR